MAALNLDAGHTVRLNEFIVVHGPPLKRDKNKKFDFRAKLDPNGSKGVIGIDRSGEEIAAIGNQQSEIRNG